LSELALHARAMREASSAVAVGLPGWVGDEVSEAKAIWTFAPKDETPWFVIETPESGSTTVRPTGRGASEKLDVSGVASTSCDWVSVE
jgi:hypothetical protein